MNLAERPQAEPESLLPHHQALDGIVDAPIVWVCRTPGLLAGMARPLGLSWTVLAEAGLTDVVSLQEEEEPAYDPAPLTGHWRPLQDLSGRLQPDDPEQEMVRLDAAVSLVQRLMDAGRGTVVHCFGGRGRTGTVVGAVLVGLGHHPDVVEAWLDRLHRARGKSDGWPESPWQSEILRRYA